MTHAPGLRSADECLRAQPLLRRTVATDWTEPQPCASHAPIDASAVARPGPNSTGGAPKTIVVHRLGVGPQSNTSDALPPVATSLPANVWRRYVLT